MTGESVRVSPKLPIERVACRAYLNADQSNLNGDEWNKINFNATTYDLGESFDKTVNYRFTVPVTGLYSIKSIVRLEGASVVADKRYLVAIYVNNSAISTSNSQASLASSLSLIIHDEAYLNKDDYVEIFVYPEVTSGVDTVDVGGIAGGTETFVTIRLITKEGIKQ